MRTILVLFLIFSFNLDAAALVARASTGFTTASTWGVSEAGASAEQLTRSSSTNTTTSYVYSSAFTCTNTDVIEGVLMRAVRLTSTGTVSIALSEDNGITATRSVTINATDLLATDNTWYFFKFGSTLTCDGGTDYKVGITGSSAGNATFYRDGTAGNWTRILRTSTTQVPVAADTFYIAGEWTAAATVTTLTVTLDETATTDYGQMDIGEHGVATAGTTASTNYYFRTSADMNVWAGGTLSLGTVGTPVPSTSTFKLNFDCGSNVQYGLLIQNQGTFIVQGASKTVKAFLAADAAASATALTTDVSTGWKNGDEIALASTTRTYTDSEKKTMGADASGTAIGTIAALASAHSGTAPTRAELANLTRNVQIFGASASLQMYIRLMATSISDVDYGEFYWMGSGTGNKRGIDVELTTGTANWQYFSIHDFAVSGSIGMYVQGVRTAGSITVSNGVFYNCYNHCFNIVLSTAEPNWTVSNNLAIRTLSSYVYYFQNWNGTITGNTATSGVADGIWIAPTDLTEAQGTFSDNVTHSNGAMGFYVGALMTKPMTFTNTTSWRNNNFGFRIPAYMVSPVTINGLTAFGNLTTNLHLGSCYTVTLNSATLNGDTTFSVLYGIYFVNSIGGANVIFNNSNLGTASGILTTHSTADLYFESYNPARVFGSNVTLASATPVSTVTTSGNVAVGINKLGGVSGTNKTWLNIPAATTLNTITTDSVIYDAASPSARHTPLTTVIKLQSSYKTVAVNSGDTVTFTVRVRKSSSGDAGGADYNGAQPRLMIVTNPAAGIGTGATDIVGDTMTVAVGNWETLTYTTSAVSENAVLSAYVDGDGTAGWFNVDTWSVTNPQPTGAEKYWLNGGTQLTIPGSGATAATIAYPMIQ